MAEIHPTAVIAKGAQLGRDVAVGAFSVIDGHVTVGDGSRIGPHVSIFSHVTIGEGTEIHAGAVLGDTPQDLSFGGAASWVRIGKRCRIREGVTIHRGTKPDTGTTLGDDCYLMAFSHVAHNVVLGDRVILANGVLLAGYVDIGAGAFVSGNAVIHQFCRIGRLAMLGGGCGISKDVPPFCTTRPVALNRIAGLNVIGLRRSGMDSVTRQKVKHAFTLLYRSDLPTREAVSRILTEHASGPASELAEFVKVSKRGIAAFRLDADDADDGAE